MLKLPNAGITVNGSLSIFFCYQVYKLEYIIGISWTQTENNELTMTKKKAMWDPPKNISLKN